MKISSVSDIMHLHWEKSHNTAGDCNIRSLSWMGRVPDEIPQVRNVCSPASDSVYAVLKSLSVKNSSGQMHLSVVNHVGQNSSANVSRRAQIRHRGKRYVVRVGKNP